MQAIHDLKKSLTASDVQFTEKTLVIGDNGNIEGLSRSIFVSLGYDNIKLLSSFIDLHRLQLLHVHYTQSKCLNCDIKP